MEPVQSVQNVADPISTSVGYVPTAGSTGLESHFGNESVILKSIVHSFRSLDFSVSHSSATRFDDWFMTAFGPQHSYTRGMPFMTPHAVATMALLYLAVVVLGYLVVRSSGFKLKMKPVMRIYNAFMVCLSFYMGTKSILLARASNMSLFCVPLATGTAGMDMARLTWLFTFSKVVEFLDTFFMLAEGRLRQVSFLHVYHHVTILAFWFCISWIVPGSDGYFSLAGNSFIHVAMYSYYLLASFGYSPWWKYYMTKAQILQFVLFCVQSVYVGYIRTEKHCAFPNILSRGLLWYMLTLIALFMHFLVTNKGKSAKKRVKQQ